MITVLSWPKKITLLSRKKIKMTTEEKIINQTIHLIDTSGYQNLSLRKLTKELGLTTGAFYRHFKDKNELFQKQ